jgi:hypothetical protein
MSRRAGLGVTSADGPIPRAAPRDPVPFNRCAVAVEHAAEHVDFMHVDLCQLRMIGVNQAIRCGFCQSRTRG